MTKEQIFTEIQNVVSNNPVLVIGSGASVPYHIPGMDSLATALKLFSSSHPYTNSDSVKAVQDHFFYGHGFYNRNLFLRLRI